MTKPIEIIHQNFETKLETLRSLFNILADGVIGLGCRGMLDEVGREYQEQTLEILCDYFTASDLKTKCQTVDRYMQIIVGKNFMTKLEQVHTVLRDEHTRPRDDKTGPVLTAEQDTRVNLLFKQYQNTPVDTDIRKLDYKTCPNCRGRMNLDGPRSELRCTKCDYILTLKGMMYDENHMYSNDGSLAKRGAYETSRHCRYHVERILAIKNPNIPESVIGPGGKIDRWLERNFKYPKLATCPDYRRCLKEIDETKYNEHVPYIRQVKSGISPDRLFHHEMRLLYIYFEKAVTAFNEIKADERANLKYYPYFIYKIIEIILHKPEDKKRLQSIVNCIHFQRDNTIVANDRLWEQICERVPEFTFRKTDRNLLGIE
jgi:hypothetical protein